MEETKPLPLFRKIDQEVFTSIDQFKRTPNYNPIQDFYNGLEEEQQKLFKAIAIFLIILLPLLGLGMIWLTNKSLAEDLKIRTSLVSKANEIIGQSQSIEEIIPRVFATNPIDSESMMSSRLSGLLSQIAIDLSKIQVKSFTSDSISNNVMRAEADFAFNNLSNDELMNLFTTMISREKFRISSVEVKRNSDTNLLQGQFHAIHYSSFSTNNGEE